jgi:hypothetical protein
VKGSHKSIPSKILKDRRILDDEVKSFYKEEDVLEITGKAGSIIAVDTRGLHKGKPLVDGARLLFQIQYSNSLFGADYSGVTVQKFSEEQAAQTKKYKRTYQLFKRP